MDKVRVAFLGGYNKGKAKKHEEKEKRELERKFSNGILSKDKLLRSYKVLLDVPYTNKTVLENTLEAFIDSELIDVDNSFIIGGKSEIEEKCDNIPFRVVEQENSLFLNSKKAVRELFSDGYDGYAMISTADLPAIKTEDVDDFLLKSKAIGKDFVMGMGDVNRLYDFISKYPELKKAGKISKGYLSLVDDSIARNNSISHTHFGNTFFINKKVYDKLNDISIRLEPVIDLKKLFNNPDNFRLLAHYLKNEGVPDSVLPRENHPILDYLSNMENKYGKETIPAIIASYIRGGVQTIEILNFARKNSNIIRKLWNARVKKNLHIEDYAKTSELENIFEDRVLDNIVSFGCVEVHPRVLADTDYQSDLMRNGLIIKNNY